MTVHGSTRLGNPEWAPFFLRLTLGTYFIALGLWGAEDFKACADAVQKYSDIGGNMGVIYATTAPYILIVSGALLLLGMWTVGAAGAAILCLFPLLYGAGLFDMPTNFPAHRNIYRDACIFGACISLLFTGGGLLSIDRFMKADK